MDSTLNLKFKWISLARNFLMTSWMSFCLFIFFPNVAGTKCHCILNKNEKVIAYLFQHRCFYTSVSTVLGAFFSLLVLRDVLWQLKKLPKLSNDIWNIFICAAFKEATSSHLISSYYKTTMLFILTVILNACNDQVGVWRKGMRNKNIK